MTEKRFTKQEVYDGINRYQINESNFIVEILDDGIPMHYSTIVNRLNEQHKTITRLEKKNEQLKKDCTTLVYSNQEYRQENENLKKQLDYIQNSINEHIKHQKTELGQKALRKIIEDYNEWMLGHKEIE